MQNSWGRLLGIILQGVILSFFCVTIALNSLTLLADPPLPKLESGQHTLHALVKKNNQTYPATLVRLPDTSYEFFSTLESLYGSKTLVIQTPNIFCPNFVEKNWKYGVFFDLESKPEQIIDERVVKIHAETRFIYNPIIYAPPSEKYEAQHYPTLMVLCSPASSLTPYDEVQVVRFDDIVYFFPKGL